MRRSFRRWPFGGWSTICELLFLGTIAGCAPQHRVEPHGPDGSVVETTDRTFIQDVIEPGRPTVVYYWANGCVPCLFFGPKVKDLAARYSGRVTFWKMNLGWSAERVRRYRIRAVPALAFYVGDHEISKMIGMPDGKTSDSLVVFVESGLKRVQVSAPKAAGTSP